MPLGKQLSQRLRERLLQERRRLLKGLAETLSDQRDSEAESFPDLGDQAHWQRERERLNHLSEKEREHLRAIDEALGRLSGGEGGECIDCDAPIPEGRLLAHPAAQRCVACQSAHEREQKTPVAL